MIGLLSFAPIARNRLGTDHFFFFYLSSCFFSSYCSWIWRCFGARSFISSLGASGAVYSVAALAATMEPSLSLSFIFFPFVSFNACMPWISCFMMQTVPFYAYASLRFFLYSGILRSIILLTCLECSGDSSTVKSR